MTFDLNVKHILGNSISVFSRIIARKRHHKYFTGIKMLPPFLTIIEEGKNNWHNVVIYDIFEQREERERQAHTRLTLEF